MKLHAKAILLSMLYVIQFSCNIHTRLICIADCRTGEAKITQGFDLPARHIIHTVGPKYNARYKTAAETALYFCYRYTKTSFNF